LGGYKTARGLGVWGDLDLGRVEARTRRAGRAFLLGDLLTLPDRVLARAGLDGVGGLGGAAPEVGK